MGLLDDDEFDPLLWKGYRPPNAAGPAPTGLPGPSRLYSSTFSPGSELVAGNMQGDSVGPQHLTPSDRIANALLPDSREGRANYPNYTRAVEGLTGSRGVGPSAFGVMDAAGLNSAYDTGGDIGHAYLNSDKRGMALGAGETILSAIPIAGGEKNAAKAAKLALEAKAAKEAKVMPGLLDAASVPAAPTAPATGLLGADSRLEGALRPTKDPVRGETSKELVRQQKAVLSDVDKETLDKLQQTNPAFAKASKLMLPDELVPLLRNPEAIQQTMRLMDVLPSASEMSSMMKAGAPKQGWYRGSTQALVDVFGKEDAPRFASLLAATSPQTSVESNLMNTLNIWKNWTAAGRPTDEASIKAIMGRSVQGTKGEDSVLQAWVNNTMRSLQAEDPRKVTLSGPKVDSFFRNLADDVYRFTNDAWMANATGIDQGILRVSPTAKQLASGNPGFSPGYTALSARGRKAAQDVNMYPGEGQETAWSLAMPLMEEARKQGITSKEVLQRGLLTPEKIKGTPDFSSLLQNPEYRSILEQSGYGEQLAGLKKFDFPNKLPELTGKDQQNLMQTADRLDQLRSMRDRESRSLVQGSRLQPESVTGYASSEGIPGQGTRHAEDLINDTQGRRDAFSSKIMNAFQDAQGVDIVHKGVGLNPIQTRTTQGVFQPPTGPLEMQKAWASGVEVPVKYNRRGEPSLSDADMQRMRTSAAVRGSMTAQLGSPVNAQIANPNGRNLVVPLDGKLKQENLRGLLDEYPLDGNTALVDQGAGVNVLKFEGEPMANEMAGYQAGLLGGKDFHRTSELTNPERNYYDLTDEWAAPVGSRQVTNKLMTELDALKPRDLKRLDNDELRLAAGDIEKAYQERSAKRGSELRPDLMNLLSIVKEKGLAGLRAALDDPNQLLPALAAIGLAPVLLRASQRGDQAPGTSPGEAN